MTKRIGFDVDGVLADFNQKFVSLANERFHKAFTTADVTNWNYTGLYTPEEVDEVWAEVIKPMKNFWQTVAPLTPGTELLSDLEDDDHTIYFVTSRVPSAGVSIEAQTQLWLETYYNIAFPQVIVVDPASQKVPAYNLLRLDAFVDDKPSTVKAMLQAGQNVFIYDQPYNQGVDAPRVHSIGEYLDRIGAR